MNLKSRLEQLERGAFIDLPMSKADVCRWFVMLTESRGTGHATGPVENYTEADWQWFRENEEKAKQTMTALRLGEKRRR